MRKFKIILFLINMASIFLYGQSKVLKEVIPPTPETQSFFKIAENLSNGFQGNATFSVPIYDVINDNLTIPIYLQYASNSNEVRNKSSRIGLGWNLNAGGMVSRTIRGLPDELPNGYLNCYKCSELFEKDKDVRKKLSDLSGYNESTNFYDSEPDIYSFSFLNYSGKFIINNSTYTAVTQGKSDLKIDLEFASNRKEIQRIIFTDLEGNRYYFGKNKNSNISAIEKHQNITSYYYNMNTSELGDSSQPDVTSNCIVGWGLLEIELNTKKSITFDYSSNSVYYYQVASASSPKAGVEIIGYGKFISSELMLNKINFLNGYVEFKYDSNLRKDLEGGKALKEIKIYDSKSSLIKSTQLNQFYTESVKDRKLIPILNNDQYAKRRLMLGTIAEYDFESKTYKTAYKMDYNVEVLPSRHSNAIDLWGYYNGNNNNEGLYNNVTDRTVNSLFSKASLLEKVTHNTNGQIVWEYEQNEVRKPSLFKDLSILGITDKDKAKESIKSTTKSVGMFKSKDHYSTKYGAFDIEFEVKSENSQQKVNINADFDPIGCNPMMECHCIYSAFVYDEKGSSVISIKKGNTNFLLLPGKYHLRVQHSGSITLDYSPDQRPDFCEEFSIMLSWINKEEVPLNPEDYPSIIGPGNRVKKIEYFTDSKLEKEVYYEYVNDNNKTTGILYSIPGFLTILRKKIPNTNAIIVRGKLFNFDPVFGATYDSTYNTDYNGNEYGYSQITIIEGDTKNIQKFSTYSNVGPYYVYPFHVPVDLSWTRGYLLSQSFFKKTNTSWDIVKKIENKYKFYEELEHPFPWSLNYGTGVEDRNDEYFDRVNPDSQTVNIGPPYIVNNKKSIVPLYKFHNYMDYNRPEEVENTYFLRNPDKYRKSYFIGGTMNLISQETTTYEGSTSITTKENFSYSSPIHNQITESSVRNSLGDVTTTKYKYAGDITNNSIATQMSQQNILSNYLEKETTFNQTRILKETNDFKNIGNNVIRLNSSKVEKGISTDIHTLYTINYDGKANVSEVINADNSKTTLLYGYNNSLLIAKIENASKEEVASALGVSVANLHTIDESKLAQINNLRNNNTSLKEAQVTTYEHKPLVGVTKITDPKGVYMTYEYDGLNRLKWIKDHLGNILQEYQYNYKNN